MASNFFNKKKETLVFFLVTVSLILFGLLVWVNRSGQAPADDTSNSNGDVRQVDVTEIIQEIKSKDWNVQNTPALAEIITKDAEIGDLYVEFTWPPQIAHVIKSVIINCREGDYYLSDRDVLTKLTKNEFFTIANSETNYLQGICDDQNCNNINSGCYLCAKNTGSCK